MASTRPFEVCRELGTIAMLIVEPGLDDRELVRGLLDAAEGYLRGRGAKVVYGGGLFPLNPFYWGLYGGSEGSGVLSGHAAFHRGLIDGGYEPISSTVLLEMDLSTAEPRDPRGALIRRQTQLEFDEDACRRTGGKAWRWATSTCPTCVCWRSPTAPSWRGPPPGTWAGSTATTGGRASA